MPVALAPVGLTGMQCADGEIKAARAAAKFEFLTPYQRCQFARLRTSQNIRITHFGFRCTHSKTTTLCAD